MHNCIRIVFLPEEANGPHREMSCIVLWEKSCGYGQGGRVIEICLKDKRTE